MSLPWQVEVEPECASLPLLSPALSAGTTSKLKEVWAKLSLEGRAGAQPSWEPWQGRGEVPNDHCRQGYLHIPALQPAHSPPRYARFLRDLYVLGLAMEVGMVERKKQREAVIPSLTATPPHATTP